MHAADTSLRKPRRTALMLVGVRARRETTLAVAALAAISAHLLDDNLFQPQPGTAPADHFVSTAVPLAALLAFAAAYPLLQRYSAKATIYIISGWVGKSDYMSWDDLRALAASPRAINAALRIAAMLAR